MSYYTLTDSPIGQLLLAADDELLAGLYMPSQKAYQHILNTGTRQDDNPILAAARDQLHAYFQGKLTAFDLPLVLRGTSFQVRVWDELKKIPYGQTTTYGELARRIGNPSASRAVGLAVGRNPISVIVPCHRVIGTNGKLTGYAGGLPAKQALLNLECHRSYLPGGETNRPGMG